jgi:hypothetical protein
VPVLSFCCSLADVSKAAKMLFIIKLTLLASLLLYPIVTQQEVDLRCREVINEQGVRMGFVGAASRMTSNWLLRLCMKYYSEQGDFPASEIAGTVVGSQRLLLYMDTQSACLKKLYNSC